MTQSGPYRAPIALDGFFNRQWGHTAAKAVDAWNAGYTGSGAKVAVLDGGFSLNHPDIASQYDPGCTTDITGEGIAYGPPERRPTLEVSVGSQA
jgi:subtilisin family serine protease